MDLPLLSYNNEVDVQKKSERFHCFCHLRKTTCVRVSCIFIFMKAQFFVLVVKYMDGWIVCVFEVDSVGRAMLSWKVCESTPIESNFLTRRKKN